MSKALSAFVAARIANYHPELRELLPSRGPKAVECECIRHPEIFGKVICPACCGLGWVQAIDDEHGVAK
jgi:hypothetical protein